MIWYLYRNPQICSQQDRSSGGLGTLLDEKLGLPLSRCQAKRNKQAKLERRKDWLVAAIKENTGDLSQSSVSPKRKIEVLS